MRRYLSILLLMLFSLPLLAQNLPVNNNVYSAIGVKFNIITLKSYNEKYRLVTASQFINFEANKTSLHFYTDNSNIPSINLRLSPLNINTPKVFYSPVFGEACKTAIYSLSQKMRKY